jgi:phage-related protein
MFEIIFYSDKNGNAPIVEFLEALNKQAKTNKNDRINHKKIVQYIEILSRYGTFVGEPYVKHIENDIWELRPLKNRIFFFYWEDDKLVLLHHFVKKSQKTPKREIDKAKQNLVDFLERID